MKSFNICPVLSLSFFLASQCSAAPYDGPVKPNRSLPAPGATRATARFGPFKLPSTTVTGPMGMTRFNIDNIRSIPVLCKSCTYTYVRGDMVYKDGTSANVGNGAYLHHITLIFMPPG
jgi:hypothetical protein